MFSWENRLWPSELIVPKTSAVVPLFWAMMLFSTAGAKDARLTSIPPTPGAPPVELPTIVAERMEATLPPISTPAP